LIAEGFAKLAMISVMLKRLTEPAPKPANQTSESGSYIAKAENFRPLFQPRPPSSGAASGKL
jgi:hypothetical protein